VLGFGSSLRQQLGPGSQSLSPYPSAPWTRGTHITHARYLPQPTRALATGDRGGGGRLRPWATIPHWSQPLCGIKPFPTSRPTLPCLRNPESQHAAGVRKRSFPSIQRKPQACCSSHAVQLPVLGAVIRSCLCAVAASSRAQPPHRRRPRVPVLVVPERFRRNTVRHRSLRPPHDTDVGSLPSR
jgi:hypothetical protein